MQAETNQDTTGQTIRLIQITDTHLSADPEEQLAGLNCHNSFLDVVELIKRQQNRMDCIICTGDIAQDASITAYRRFLDTMAVFEVPQRWIPGNHDVMNRLREAVEGNDTVLEKNLILGNWHIVMLDSCVEGKVHGLLRGAELEFLRDSLRESERSSLHTLVCVHHNPLPVRAQWLQHHCLRNSGDFLELIDGSPSVRCVLWGHIHQEFDTERNGVRMLASPSTCVQFHPENDEFTLDDKNPGYRWFDLYADGTFETAVERVAGAFDIDFSSTGY